MSKRFTDSTKFRDPWYRKLSPKMKCLWEYILAECDLAGILEFDIDAIEFHIGEPISIDDLISLGKRVYFLEENKIFIPKFVQFQQGTLNSDNRAHKAIFSAFEKYNIPTDLNMDDFTSPLDAPYKPLGRGQGIGNSNSIGNSVVKVKEEKHNYENEFDKLWLSWKPYEMAKGNKKTALQKYKIIRKGLDYETIRDGVARYIDYCHATQCKTKHVTTWLNQNGWDDDYTIPDSPNKKSSYLDSLANASRAVQNGMEADFDKW
jgi:hypothetical protein